MLALVAAAWFLSAVSMVPPVTFAVALVALYGVVAHKWPRPVRAGAAGPTPAPAEAPAEPSGPRPRQRPPVPVALRVVDALWLLVLASVAPALGIGPGSECEGCGSVWVGLWFTWVGLAVCALLYAWSLRRRASATFARVMAVALVPATIVIVYAGLHIAVGRAPAWL
jgi:hypothetical protein